jgi:hypothetical protein
MSTPYEQRRKDLLKDIAAQKLLYKFRTFLYSLNKDVRVHCFSLCELYLNNELHDGIQTVSENTRLHALVDHWKWSTFETSASDWWKTLSIEHARCHTLMTLIHLWIDDIQTMDGDMLDNATVSMG